MDKQAIYDALRARGCPFEVTEHAAAFNMDELSALRLPYPDREAKNLFVRDDKKQNYYLITVKGDKRVDLKEFRARNGTRRLSFAAGDELEAILHLGAGSVTPFGLLNDGERRVKFFLDRELLEGSGLVGVHPNDNTATVWLRTEELLEILRGHGSEVHLAQL